MACNGRTHEPNTGSMSSDTRHSTNRVVDFNLLNSTTGATNYIFQPLFTLNDVTLVTSFRARCEPPPLCHGRVRRNATNGSFQHRRWTVRRGRWIGARVIADTRLVQGQQQEKQSRGIERYKFVEHRPRKSRSILILTINHLITRTSTPLTTFKMQFSIATLVSLLAAAEVATAWQSTSNPHPDRPQTIN